MQGLEKYRLDIATKKKSDIIAAATALFGEYGFTNTTVAAIAHKADVSTATIYKHFGSKEILFAAVVQSVTEAGSREDTPPKDDDHSTHDYILKCLVAEGSSIVRRVNQVPSEQAQAVELVKKTFSRLEERYRVV